MAKFTKSNRTIVLDGSATWDRGITQPMSDTGQPPINRISNAAPAVDDNDYIIKSQAFTIIDTNLSLFVVASAANGDINNSGNIDGSDTNDGLSWATAFATPNQAVAYLSNKIASNNVSVTINIADGVWKSPGSGTTTGTAIINVAGLDLSRVDFNGSPPKEFNFTNVSVLSSPPAGKPAISNYNQYFRFSTSTNPITSKVNVGDWLFVYAYSNRDAPSPQYELPSGGDAGANWSGDSTVGLMKVVEITSTYITGQYKIFDGTIYSEVDGTPHVESHRGFEDAVNFYPSTSVTPVTGRIGVLSTVFKTGVAGGDPRRSGAVVNINDSSIRNLRYIAAENDFGSPVGPRGGIISLNSTANYIFCTAFGFGRGLSATVGATVDMSHCCASNNVAGILAYNSGNIIETNTVTTGNKWGFWVATGSTAVIRSALAFTNYAGIYVSGSSQTSSSYFYVTKLYNCGTGIAAAVNSAIQMSGEYGGEQSWFFNWNNYNGSFTTGITYFKGSSFIAKLADIPSYDVHFWDGHSPVHEKDLITAGAGNPNFDYIQSITNTILT